MADENTPEAPATPPAEGVVTDDATTKANEWNDRAGAFIRDYGDLVKKHKVDFASFPQFVPDGAGGFKIVVQNVPVDVTNQPVKSPFVATKDL